MTAPWYRDLAEQLATRIRALGLTMQQVDDKAGVPDGYTSKALHPDTSSGRQPVPNQFQYLLEALWGHGGRLLIVPRLTDEPPKSHQPMQMELPLEDEEQRPQNFGQYKPIPRTLRGGRLRPPPTKPSSEDDLS